MSIQIYKPNKSNTGFAFNFSMGVDKRSLEPVLFVSAIAQHSWDSKKRIGSFSESKNNPEKNINLKFNEFECGSIVDAIQRRYEYSTFHQFEDNKTTIKFTPWDKDVKSSKFNPSTKKYEEYTYQSPAFGISITKNGSNTFKIPLEPGEALCVKEYITQIIQDLYKHRFKVRMKEFKKSQRESDSEECPI